MAVRTKLAKAVKATLVAFAIGAGAVLVAPGVASATPAPQQPASTVTALAPSQLRPIGVAAPVRAVWQCRSAVWLNGGGVDFDCAVQQGVVYAVIYCSDGSYYYNEMFAGRHQFYLFCGAGAWVINYEVLG